MAGTLADIQACYDCLRTRFSKQPGDIVLYGQSVGRWAMSKRDHSTPTALQDCSQAEQ